ncbi:protein S100-A1-like isoform X2 [Gouania willdenowi]|nr:protein S100-A1-like isoform X2 [Gouania willdenowi]
MMKEEQPSTALSSEIEKNQDFIVSLIKTTVDIMCDPCQGISETTLAIGLLYKVFHQYAASDDDKEHLSKSEVKTLLTSEIPCLFKDQNDAADQIFSDLDQNGDQKLDFPEFMTLVASLGVIFHEIFHEIEEKHLKGRGKQ